MRTAVRLIVSVLILLTVSGRGPLAAAEEASPQHQAWAQTGAVPAAAVADERLYVGSAVGEEQTRSFVQLTVQGMEPGALEGARLVLGEDTAQSVLAETAQVAACVLVDPLVEDGQLDGELPNVDCTLRVDATRDADGRWSVRLGVFAPRWTSDVDVGGLALLPAVGNPASNFRVAFDPARTIVEGLDSTDASAFGPLEDSTPSAGDAPTVGPEPAEAAPYSFSVAADPAGPVVPELPPTGSPSQPRPPSAADGGLPGDEVSAFGPTAARSADSPPYLPFVVGLGLVSAAGVAVLGRRGRRIHVPPRLAGPRGMGVAGLTAAVGLALLPLAASEITVYKSGLLLIFLVGALGLHILINWAGQLSLAHAGMVGLPAFVVITVSEIHQISPLHLLPLGIVTGAVLGALVALPTIRARGLQVALVTLVAGIAIDRFFFTKTWLVGSAGGRTAATPALGPLELTTIRAFYPVLVAVVAVTLVAVWALMHSRVARSWYWIRADPDAAAVFGIPVTHYKIAAFATAGAFAGLAGGLTVAWVQRSSAGAFPASLSFSYLLVAVLAGHGYAGGVAMATLLLQGGRVFIEGAFGSTIDDVVAYLGPIALIFNITVYQAGFNGVGREAMERLRKWRSTHAESLPDGAEAAPRVSSGSVDPEPLGLGLIAGALAVAAGFIAIVLGWYHAGNTSEVWIQNQELLSGGVGGLALVILGVGLLIRDRLGKQQAILADQQTILARQLLDLLGAAEGAAHPLPAVVTERRREVQGDSPARDGNGGTGPRRRPLSARP